MNLINQPFMDTEKYPFDYERNKGRLVDTTHNVYIDYEAGSLLAFWVKSDFDILVNTSVDRFKNLHWTIEKRLDGLDSSVKLTTPCRDTGIVAVSKKKLKKFAYTHKLCEKHKYAYGEIHLDPKKKEYSIEPLNRLVKQLRGMVTIKSLDAKIPDKIVLYTELDKVNHLNMMLCFSEEKDKQSFIDSYDCVIRFEDGSFMAPTKGQVPFNVGKNFQIIKNNNESFFGLVR